MSQCFDFLSHVYSQSEAQKEIKQHTPMKGNQGLGIQNFQNYLKRKNPQQYQKNQKQQKNLLSQYEKLDRTTRQLFNERFITKLQESGFSLD